MLDAGDLFSPPGYNLYALPEKDKKLNALLIDLFMQAYNLMRYDAFTPGEIDLSLGIRELQRISQKANFPFLLTNLIDKKTKKPPFRPYFIKDLAGLKIGVFGLISPTLANHLSPADKDKYQIVDYGEAARQVIAELKNKNCQVIIALGHMEESEQRNLAQNHKEIYFIVGGHVCSLKRQPLEVRNAQIINAGTRGEYLGQMEFFLRVKGDEKRIFSHYQIIALNDQYKDHLHAAELVTQFLAKTKKLYPPKTMTSPAEKDPWMQNRSYAYPVSNYMGDQFCFPCHEQQHENWKKTGHAKAFQTLVRHKRESDHTCLPCHSTGFKEVSGFGDVLENVQCESCHGPRRGHPEKGLKFASVSEKQCLTCHNAAKSPNFNYASYLAKVRCPGSSLARATKRGE
ncbi:MAG: multiheme c-type cytochrome [Thermodesulfobacteriota bacterium]